MHRHARTRALVAAGLLLATAACSGTGEPAGPTTSAAPDEQADARTDERADDRCTPPDTGAVEVAKVEGSTSDLDVTSFDGTTIRAHWFPLPGSSATATAPVVLMGPGWGLAGDTSTEEVGLLGAVSIGGLHEAGYHVLTWDPRGFGRSSGVANVNDKDLEGRDVSELISFVATDPAVELDGEGDPRMGMVGASYGGGIQFVTAATDCRVDAIVPVIAWHSLETSLYKGKVPKTGWAGVLTGVSALGKVDPHIPSAKASGDATGTISDEDAEWFRSRGPGDLVEKVDVPTMVVQGTVDTLFTLDEGVTNYEVLAANDVPVAMVWFCGGHGVCNAERGDEERVNERIVAWLDRWVAGDATVDTGPGFDMIDQDGARHTAPAWPAAGGEPVVAEGSGTLELVEEGGSFPPTAASGDVLGPVADRIMPGVATNAVDVTVPLDDRDALVVGAPTLELTYRGTVPDGERPEAVFAQLVDDRTRTVVGQQVTPVPLDLDGEEHSVTVPLEMVAYRARGGSLTLQLVATTAAYATPRLGGSVEFSRVRVSLPTVTGTTSPR